MQWSQFSMEILKADFNKSNVDNSSWEKIGEGIIEYSMSQRDCDSL